MQSLETQISTIEAITFPTALTRSDASSILAILEEERSALSQMRDAGTQQTFERDLHQVVALTARLQPRVAKLRDDLASTS